MEGLLSFTIGVVFFCAAFAVVNCEAEQQQSETARTAAVKCLKREGLTPEQAEQATSGIQEIAREYGLFL